MNGLSCQITGYGGYGNAYPLAVVAAVAAVVWLAGCGAPAAVLPAEVSPTPGAATPSPLPAAPEQYRLWMEEARALYPYPEPVEVMWAVMVCESSGQADAAGPGFYGLFQYTPATWAGEWNPYRDSPILDPHAQILATAKAWHDGYQAWWSGCRP